MGGDGGSTTNDRRFVAGTTNAKEVDGKKESSSLAQRQRERSSECTLSGSTLCEGIMACELGNLYDKESIIQALLSKTLPEALSHIRKLKDLRDVKFTSSQEVCTSLSKTSSIGAISGDIGSTSGIQQRAQFVCPVTQQEFSGLSRFVLIWCTGWVLSEKAIKSLGVPALQDDFGPFTEDDLVALVPAPESAMALRNATMMCSRRAEAVAAKKV